MFFPANVFTGNTGYIAGEFNDVLETPGSVQRWLTRGCTIVEETVEEVVEEIVEEVVEVLPKIEEEKIVLPEVEDVKVEEEVKEVIVDKAKKNKRKKTSK